MTKPVLTAENTKRYSEYTVVADASLLGLEVGGQLPMGFETTLGNGKPFVLTGVAEDLEYFSYEQPRTGLGLVVYNS